MLENTKFIVFDVATNEVLSPGEYEDNQEKIKKGDPTARVVRMVDKRLVIIENNKIVGTQRITKDAPKTPEVQAQQYPTSISDFMSIEPEKQVTKAKDEETKDFDDPELFVNLVAQKQKERASAIPIVSTPEVSTVFAIPGNNEAAKRHNRLKALHEEVEALDPRNFFNQTLINSQPEEIIREDIAEPKIEEPPTIDDPYASALKRSTSKDTKPIERKHNFRFVPTPKVIAIALAAGMAFASINLARNAIINSTWYQTMQDNITMSQSIQIMEKHDAKFNDVNPNKIIIPNQYDSYQDPKYWLDTDGVAQDILNEGDKNFMAALYYAYYEMEGIRTVGEYRNWDNVISSIGRMADESTHPIAYNMTSDCHSFEGFLIKNGLVNENGEPLPEMFERLGMEALKAYSESLVLEDDSPSYGGRA